MMVALLVYAYARGNRSSRGIERECVEDVAYRVICANLVPDHSTIAEFRKRHEQALAELFTGVLALCNKAGLVSVWGGRDRRHQALSERLQRSSRRSSQPRSGDGRGLSANSHAQMLSARRSARSWPEPVEPLDGFEVERILARVQGRGRLAARSTPPARAGALADRRADTTVTVRASASGGPVTGRGSRR
jgi:hypothetical protein